MSNTETNIKDVMAQFADITFSEEQGELMEVATNFCRNKSPIDKVRELMKDDTGFDQDTWQEITELGWTAIAIPEEFDGVGLSLAELTPVIEQMGRNLMATPLAATTLAAQIIEKTHCKLRATYLPKIASGKIATVALTENENGTDLHKPTVNAKTNGDTVTFAGTKSFVEYGTSAAFIVVSASQDGAAQLYVLHQDDIPASAWTREVLIDERKRSFQLNMDGIEIPADRILNPANTAAALDHGHLVANLLLAAEAAGGAHACVAYTVEYAQTRKQFGKPIGAYQGVKHPLVDAHILSQQARSQTYAAASSFAHDAPTNTPTRELATRMAKCVTVEASSFAADRAIQFHGGFGFTYDCDAQLYRRQAFYIASQYGDPIYHRRILGDLMFG